MAFILAFAILEFVSYFGVQQESEGADGAAVVGELAVNTSDGDRPRYCWISCWPHGLTRRRVQFRLKRWHFATCVGGEYAVARSIKISDEEMKCLREEAELSSRSIAGQVEHWLRIGRAIERSPAFNYQRVREALKGLLSPDDLSGEEQEVFFEDFADEMWKPPTAEDKAAFEKHLGKGTLVGLDDKDVLVYRRQEK